MKKYAYLALSATLLTSLSFSQEEVNTSYWTGNTREGTSGWGLSSVAENWSTGTIPDANTNVVFDNEYLTGEKILSIHTTSGFTCNDYTVTSNYGGQQIRMSGTMTINGNFTSQQKSTITFLSNGSNDSAAVLNIGKNLIAGVQGDTTGNPYEVRVGETVSNQWGGWGGPKNVTIGGDIIMYELGKVSFNVNLKGRTADYSTPDIDVKGLIRFEGNGITNPNLNIINASSKYVNNSTKESFSSEPVEVVLACNGITGNGVISNNSNGSIDNGPSKAILLLRNDSDQYFAGWIQDGQNCTTKIVMNGTATQYLTSVNKDPEKPTQGICFTGGLEIISGTLSMRYDHPINHGDLEMRGGKLKNDSVSSAWNVNFTNLIYEGGTIVSRWDGSNMDVITLSGGLQKGAGFADGDKFLIEVAATDVSSLTDELVIAWDNAAQKTDFTEDDFEATYFEGYEALFNIKDDGLYLSYIAVPEPAAFAVMLGALALGLCACRKRK